MAVVKYQKLMTVYNLGPWGKHGWSFGPNPGFEEFVFLFGVTPRLVEDDASVMTENITRYTSKAPNQPPPWVSVTVVSRVSDISGYTLLVAAIGP